MKLQNQFHNVFGFTSERDRHRGGRFGVHLKILKDLKLNVLKDLRICQDLRIFNDLKVFLF